MGNMKIPIERYYFLIMTSGVAVTLDQVTKIVVQKTMDLYQSIQVIPNLFSLTYIRNSGAAFGLFSDGGGIYKILFFVAVSFIALVILLHLYRKTPPEFLLLKLALSLVAAGAIGNLIDRIRLGEVVDFLDFYIGSYHWPAFNVADSCISVGVALLLYHTFFHRSEDPQTTTDS